MIRKRSEIVKMMEYIIAVPERTDVDDPAMVPAINQRELVRCKDCVYNRQDNYCEYNHHETKPCWFCADGERKD